MSDISNPEVKFNSPHREVENFYNDSIQLKYFGCEIQFKSENLLLVKISNVKTIHLGGNGGVAVNGGVIAYLFDLALGLTSYLVKDNKYTISVTSRIDMQFKKPLFANSIFAYAKVKEVKKNLVYSKAWIENENGVLCSIANGINFTK